MRNHLLAIFMMIPTLFPQARLYIAEAEGLPPEPDLITAIKQMEKVELHLHLGGSWPLDYLATIATPKKFIELCSFIDKINNGIVYSEYGLE